MLPKILLSDIRLATLSKLTTEEFNSLRSAIKCVNIMDIDNVHTSYLPWLAWWFRVDLWDEAWPEEQKREAVKRSLELFRYKGTLWAVKRALSIYGYDAEVLSWHMQNPTGECGTFFVNVIHPARFYADQTNKIYQLVESNKQASQTWTGKISSQTDGALYATGVLIGRRRYITKG
ncbi:phage tail protein I [Vibrio mimicus]